MSTLPTSTGKEGAAVKALQEIRDNLLDCQICMCRYTQIGAAVVATVAAVNSEAVVDRTPKMLECHHYFCFRCLVEVMSTQTVIKCPICKLVTNMRGRTLNSLFNNFVIDNLLRYASVVGEGGSSGGASAIDSQQGMNVVGSSDCSSSTTISPPSSVSVNLCSNNSANQQVLHLHCPGYQWRLRVAPTMDSATVGTFNSGQSITTVPGCVIDERYYKYSLTGPYSGQSAYVMMWTNTHKVPWELRCQSRRVRVACSGFEVRVRKLPNPDAAIVALIIHGEKLEVFQQLTGSYLKLTNNLGYVLANIEGVSFVTEESFP